MDADNKIYVGLVIANNDPELRGRIKIYIPQIGPNIPEINKNVDKFFTFIGKESNSIVSEVLETLKNILPWAEYAGPIAGGNASGRYNGFVGEGTTSDSNAWKDGKVAEGNRPAANRVSSDAFSETNIHKNKNVNQYTHQYTPSDYSGLVRGLFSIPNVGAHVYTFFINGDRNFPVYFASAYGQDDIRRIYTLSSDVNATETVDYPASYENLSSSILKTQTSDSKTFRSKTVLNSNKHTIELIDTDLREILKLTHYSGSFKEFTNYANIELAKNNDQKMVNGDQFVTVKHNQSEYIGGMSEKIIRGDRYLNIGETEVATVQNILQYLKKIHEYKLLFDTQRAQYGGVATDTFAVFGNPNDMSQYQSRVGFTGGIGANGMPLYKDGFKQCPVCGNKPYNPYDPTTGLTVNVGEDLTDLINGVSNPIIDPTELWKEISKIRRDPLTMFYETLIIIDRAFMMTEILYIPPCYSIAPPPIPPDPMALCFPIPHPFTDRPGYFLGMKCACCGGTGFSPSSENGNFNLEPAKQLNGALETTIKSLTPAILKDQASLGKGGDEITNITMNKVETIGLAMNDLKSFRVDPIGKLKVDGCFVAPQGTYENLKPSPHVEYVDVDNVPGGDYNLTCMNKYKLLVGARGVNILTYGPIDIYGTICNFNGEQINIGSKNEIVIDGGERLSLRARKISLVPVEHNAVVVDGQLHVTRNTILQGGVMCEGEVALLHVTAPAEWQTTEAGFFEKALVAPNPLHTVKCFIQIPDVTGGGVYADIQLPPHYHPFQNIPLTLLPHKEAVRIEMIQKGINSRSDIAEVDNFKNTGTFLDYANNIISELPPTP